MKKITVKKIQTERPDGDKLLAPNANNHGHVSTAFAWS